jgi:deoxyribodipyrimidine photo-lyase
MMSVPEVRVQAKNEAPVQPTGDYVLYWMIAYRRSRFNFSLERALDWARRLEKPLLVLEALRSDYRWASDRLHRFVLQGMDDNRARFEPAGVLYYPYVEPGRGAGKGLLETLAARAAVVVTDEFPTFFLPRMVARAAARVNVRLEQVDSNGLLPLRAAERVFSTAFSFRRFLQKSLPAHLSDFPRADPLRGARLPRSPRLPRSIVRRWPPATDAMLRGEASALARLPIDHTVAPTQSQGGARAAEAALDRFLNERLSKYAEERNHPDEEVTSGLSPYLHFGHISAHEVVARLVRRQGLTLPEVGSARPTGGRAGWWGMSESAEAFLDQLVTWRELGFNFCWQREDHDGYESLPDWARETLRRHARDRRKHIYRLEEFARAHTHDRIWNAAQVELRRDGRIHNYLRMVWGKKILEWTRSPEEALEVMLELNNRYALDGRDPNSVSGIFWVLGRYDRAWGPERPIFGKIRYMSSEATARKLRLRDYLRRYAPEPQAS